MMIIAMTMLVVISTDVKECEVLLVPGEVANLCMVHANHAIRAAGDRRSRLYRRLSLGLHVDDVENHGSNKAKTD